MRIAAPVSLCIGIILTAQVASNCQGACSYRVEGDLNRDCRVNFHDFAILAANWLIDCTLAPRDPACHCDAMWRAEPPMSVARDQFTAGVINGKIYVFGGNGNPDGTNLKSAEAYDLSTNQWSAVSENPHNDGQGVEELTGAVVDGKLYVFGAWGGIAPDGYYGVFNFNEMYDPVTDMWTTLAAKPTTAASGPATVYNGEIYIFGGYFDSENPSQDHVNLDVVECYNPPTNTWRFVTKLPMQITNFAIATVGHKAYLFGGVQWNESSRPRLLDDVITYDYQTDTWTTTGYEPLPDKKGFMYGSSAPVIDAKVYLIGSMESKEGRYEVSSKVDVYDTSANTWQSETSLPLPLDNHLAVVAGGKIYVLGGSNDPDFENSSKSEVISLDTRACSD